MLYRESIALRWILCSLFLTVGTQQILLSQDTPSSDPPADAKNAATEHWFGTLDAGPLELRLIVVLEPQADGTWKGELISVDQGSIAIPFETIKKSSGIEFEAARIKARYSGSFSDDKGSVEGTFTQAGRELPLKLVKGDAPQKDKVKEAWVGGIQVGENETQVQLRILENKGTEIIRFDDLTSGIMGLSAVRQPAADGLKFEVPGIAGSFEGKWNDQKDEAIGTWKQSGAAFPLTLKKKLDGAEGPIQVNRPQTPQAPFPYVTEEVTFTSQSPNVTLSGTLTLPKGDGPFPTVILITGSGPQDRDERILEHQPFWVLADHLSRKGIAVLRYDDRGTAKSTGDFTSATSEDFAQDARGGLAFLRKDSRVDPRRLGIIGHSEGGLIATMLAASDGSLAHVVLMAGPGVPGDQIVESQTKAILLASGLKDASEDLHGMKALLKAIKEDAPQETINKLMAEAANTKATLASSESDDDNSEETSDELPKQGDRNDAFMATYKQFDTPWFRFFLKYDPRPDLQKAKCPVLAVIGEKDLQVLVELNLPEIEKALATAPAKGSQCLKLDGLNHLFQTSRTGSPQEYRLNEETLSPKFLQVVEDWILHH